MELEPTQKRKETLWLICIGIVCLVAVYLFFQSNDTDRLQAKASLLEKQLDTKEKQLAESKKQNEVNQKVIDSLRLDLDAFKTSKKIQTIKQQGNEKLKAIDLYTVAVMQRYFDALTGKEGLKGIDTTKLYRIRK